MRSCPRHMRLSSDATCFRLAVLIASGLGVGPTPGRARMQVRGCLDLEKTIESRLWRPVRKDRSQSCAFLQVTGREISEPSHRWFASGSIAARLPVAAATTGGRRRTAGSPAAPLRPPRSRSAGRWWRGRTAGSPAAPLRPDVLADRVRVQPRRTAGSPAAPLRLPLAGLRRRRRGGRTAGSPAAPLRLGARRCGRRGG
jgi:hypothetical protein